MYLLTQLKLSLETRRHRWKPHWLPSVNTTRGKAFYDWGEGFGEWRSKGHSKRYDASRHWRESVCPVVRGGSVLNECTSDARRPWFVLTVQKWKSSEGTFLSSEVRGIYQVKSLWCRWMQPAFPQTFCIDNRYCGVVCVIQWRNIGDETLQSHFSSFALLRRSCNSYTLKKNKEIDREMNKLIRKQVNR